MASIVQDLAGHEVSGQRCLKVPPETSGGRTAAEAEGLGPVSGRLTGSLAGENGVGGGWWRRGAGPGGAGARQGAGLAPSPRG